MSELTKNDYKAILEFYDKPIPKSFRLLKKNAEDILVSKLCRCIKKVSSKNNNEKRSIGICTKTIINKKKLTRGKFTCKKKKKKKLTKNKKKKKKNKKIK